MDIYTRPLKTTNTSTGSPIHRCLLLPVGNQQAFPNTWARDKVLKDTYEPRNKKKILVVDERDPKTMV